MRVLSVASEVFPLIKTGGLADVAGALPASLALHGIEMRTMLPGYPAVLEKMQSPQAVWREADFFGGEATVLSGQAGGLEIFALDAPHLYRRPGNPYSMPGGQDWPDNAQRFAALSFAASLIGQAVFPGFVPDVVHAHDWQAGLTPAYLHYAGGRRPATVMTIHNLAFQGQVPASLLRELRLPDAAYSIEGVEYYQSIGMLKAGLQLCDRITTVSPSYAAEICTPEGGMGMDGLLRARADRLSGIVNGIDTTIWDPGHDALLPAPFTSRTLQARQASKAALQAQLGLMADPDVLVFGVVSRLSHQKGLDVLLGALDALLGSGAQLAVLGSGDADLEQGFRHAEAAHPGRIGMALGFNEPVAHLIQGGSDAVLIPSRFEPCGLTQLCALRYGALPVVSRVGGLADTVIDANLAARAAKVATGVMFSPVTVDALRGAIGRVAGLWAQPKAWAAIQRNAMRTDVSWVEPAGSYAALYRECAGAR